MDVKLIVLGVVIGVLLVGVLALLAWKAVVTIHDRREFARFQEEFKKSRWNVVSITILTTHRILTGRGLTMNWFSLRSLVD